MNSSHPTAKSPTRLPGSARRAFFPRISLRAVELTMFVVFLFLTPSQVQIAAQTPTPTPTPESEETRRLREEKTNAELKSDISVANKKKRDADFPAPTATPLEGKTEVDSGVKLESEMLAYRAMSDVADRIVKDMRDNVKTISVLAIHNDRDLKALMGYMVILSQIQLMKSEYDKSIRVSLPQPPSPKIAKISLGAVAGGLSAAQSVLGSFIDLIALLRTDTNIKGMDFSIEESALVSELFRAIRDKNGYGANTKLFYPAVFPPNIGVDKQFIILGRIQDLYFIRERAAKLIAEIAETETAYGETKAEIETLEKKLKGDKEDLPGLESELAKLRKIYRRWPSSRTYERIEETLAQIAKVREEILELTNAINEDKAQLEDLDKRLSELYGEILPEVLQTDTVAAVDAAINKIIDAEVLLGRAFSTAELSSLFSGFDEPKKKALVAEAETHKGSKLTEAEKEQLLAPLDRPEQNALTKISADQTAQGGMVSTALLIGLTPAEKSRDLSQADQMSLLTDPKQAALKKLKEASLARLRALNDQFDKFKAELIKVDEGAGINALTSYLQAENLLDALGCRVGAGAGAPQDACSDSYILQLKVVRAGGNNKTTRNLLKDVFTGPSISHSGGAIAEYNLFNVAGQSKSSKTFTVYTGYVKAKDIPH